MSASSSKNGTARSARQARREKTAPTSKVSEMAKRSFENRKKATEAEALAADPPIMPKPLAEKPQTTYKPVNPTSVGPPDPTMDQLALSSALRLQIIQLERAKQDMKLLAEMRGKAMEDPIGFMQHFTKAPIRQQPQQNASSLGSASPTTVESLGPTSSSSPNAAASAPNVDENADGEYEYEFPLGHYGQPLGDPLGPQSTVTTSGSGETPMGFLPPSNKRKADAPRPTTQHDRKRTNSGGSKFEGQNIPKPQEIYRCPNIDWEKYGVCKAPLEMIYDAEKRLSSGYKA